VSIQRLLVPTDFSEASLIALDRAKEIAKAHEAEIVVLNCAPPPELSIVAIEPMYATPQLLEKFSKDRSDQISNRLGELVNECSAGGVKARSLVKAVTPVEGIIKAAESESIDLIVMSSHGAGLDRFLLGSVAERITRESSAPVMVVRSADATLEKAVIGVDFSPFSKPLVAFAESLLPKTTLIELVHVWQPPHLDTAHLFGDPGHESLASVLTKGLDEHMEALQRFAESLPSDRRYSVQVLTDRPAQGLLDRAKEIGAGSIFVGAHDSDRLENLMGTVSDRVLRHAPITVLFTEQMLQSDA
jgi:nucleotide-binding universal stress UspA family protein